MTALSNTSNVTPVLSVADRRLVSGELAFWRERLYGEEAHLDLEWQLHGRFEVPGTWTQEEVSESFRAMSQLHLKSRCFLMLMEAPDDIMPAVCSELAEIIRYETSILLAREASGKSQLIEKWSSVAERS